MTATSPEPNTAETTPVLIAGGSLIGLCMSLFLGRHGISSVVVERHPGTSIHPRVASLTARTMEIFRAMDAEEAIRQVEPVFSTASRVPLAESLVGEEIDNLMEDFGAFFTDASPAKGSLIAQDVLETVLPGLASRAGADLRYQTELVGFEQDADGVVATVRDGRSGTDHRLRAGFLVAADGVRSGVRKQLGIDVHGAAGLGSCISILFEAPKLMDLFHEREAVMCFLGNDVIGTGALTAYPGSSARPDRFRLDVAYDPDVETVADYPEDRCVPLVRGAIGIPDHPVEFKTVMAWDMNAVVADRFQEGRVFLVGDAARAQPPSGALGGNTGIAEAHNLAWKLAAVLKGHAGSGLLATYDLERRPVADHTVEQALLLSQQRGSEGSEGITVNTLTLNMGYRYGTGAAIVPDGNEDELPAFQDPSRWTGRPGTRAPHVVLEREGRTISTLDLFGSGFVLLAGPEGQGWVEAGELLPESLRCHRIGGGGLTDRDGRFCEAYGITAGGAVIMRPDGFVGWRSRSGADGALQELPGALSTLLFH